MSISATGRPSDEDAWVWPNGEPAFDNLFAEQAEEISMGDQLEKLALITVAERLRGELHMPAVREALGCLIPEELHPRLDGKKPRTAKGDAERVGVTLSAGQWKVDVSAEAALHSGRTMSKDILEFFLKVLRRVSDMLGPPLFIGNSALGRKVGSGEELSDMCRTVEGWRSWNHEERERARAASEF